MLGAGTRIAGNGMTTGGDVDSLNQNGESARRYSRSVQWVASLLVLALFAIVLFVFLIGPEILTRYDKAHMTTISCEVNAAYAGSASTRSLKGGGTSFPQVEYRSSDCGTLMLSRGLTAELAEKRAAEIVRGERYDFRIGEGSARLRGLFQAVGVAANVTAVRADGGN
jgi:hypothetical protein